MLGSKIIHSFSYNNVDLFYFSEELFLYRNGLFFFVKDEQNMMYNVYVAASNVFF
jgi:hypothetical protein